MKVFVVVLAIASAVLAAPTADNNLQIVGGHNARRGQFPHQISFQACLGGLSCSHICGGTIVSARTVITAGHCILQSSYYTFRVVAGILELNGTNPERQAIQVSKINIHPGYNVKSESVQPHDIAVVTLRSKLTFNSQVQPARLPTQGYWPRGTVILSGWGSTVPDTRNANTPNTLQTANFTVIDDIRTCLDELRRISRSTSIPLELNGGNVCFTAPVGTSACVGDSGGPMVTLDGVFIAIVSWGLVPCGQTGSPNVFANVGHYVNWILSQISN